MKHFSCKIRKILQESCKKNCKYNFLAGYDQNLARKLSCKILCKILQVLQEKYLQDMNISCKTRFYWDGLSEIFIHLLKHPLLLLDL